MKKLAAIDRESAFKFYEIRVVFGGGIFCKAAASTWWE